MSKLILTAAVIYLEILQFLSTNMEYTGKCKSYVMDGYQMGPGTDISFVDDKYNNRLCMFHHSMICVIQRYVTIPFVPLLMVMKNISHHINTSFCTKAIVFYRHTTVTQQMLVTILVNKHIPS